MILICIKYFVLNSIRWFHHPLVFFNEDGEKKIYTLKVAHKLRPALGFCSLKPTIFWHKKDRKSGLFGERASLKKQVWHNLNFASRVNLGQNLACFARVLVCNLITGVSAFHAVPTNSRAIGSFRYHVMEIWLMSFRRRSQKYNLTLERMIKLAAAWLPTPRILHPWPQQRFAV